MLGEAVGDVVLSRRPSSDSQRSSCTGGASTRPLASEKLPRGGARTWLTKLLRRPPLVRAPNAAASAAWAASEMPAAQQWADEVAKALKASRAAEETLISLVTALSLDELRAVQSALSAPADAEHRPILLHELVAAGVGGRVAQRQLLAKIGASMVPDSDEPLALTRAYTLLPGREPTLPLRFAEGEEDGAARRPPPRCISATLGRAA